jgi:release factor glutamine methyltransferase
MSETESWTVGRLLTWTTDYLKRQGSDTPRLDAEVLLATARGCQRIELYTAFNDPVADEIRTAFRDLVKRRAGGEPVAYLVGHREFYSLTFEVTSDVLIPRPETEDLVMRVVDRAKHVAATLRSLCRSPMWVPARARSRSASLATSPGSHCDGHRHQPRRPGRRAPQRGPAPGGRTHRIRLRRSARPPPARRPVRLVVSNPPYVSRSEWESLKIDVRQHEPYQALVAGETGTEVIARLIPQAADRLRAGGWLLLEISPMIEAAVTCSTAGRSPVRSCVGSERFRPPASHRPSTPHSALKGGAALELRFIVSLPGVPLIG